MTRNSVHAVSHTISKDSEQHLKLQAFSKLRISIRLDILLLSFILEPQDLLYIFAMLGTILNSNC